MNGSPSIETWADWNGEIVPLKDLRVSVQDRAFLFGDAAYEVIRIYGGRPWRFAEHLDRLAHTLREMRITLELDALERRALALLDLSRVREGQIYCQISRGVAKRSHAFPSSAPNQLIYVEAITSDVFAPYRESGISVVTIDDQRWGRRDLKTVNLLPNCMARQSALDAGAQDAIFVERPGMERAGTVTEATAANVFLVREDGVLLTCPCGPWILAGVTRAFVIELARKLGFRPEEAPFPKEALFSASEVFLTGTISEVLPVTRIDGKIVGNGKPGPVTHALSRAFREAVERNG